MLVYALLNRDDAVQFIAAFFILYVFFTAFEVVLSLSHSKRNRPIEPIIMEREKEEELK